MTTELNAVYWDSRHLHGQTGWDIKQVSPPLKAYFDSPLQPLGKVLIPGCGKAHEADYLLMKGHSDIVVLDFAPSLMADLSEHFKSSQVQVKCENIFEHSGLYDTIVEQTLFCAIDPSLRLSYVNKIADLLDANGVWFGVLFNRQFEQAGPPFGGDEIEYRSLFETRFECIQMAPCSNSIEPRAGTELFFIAKKKK